MTVIVPLEEGASRKRRGVAWNPFVSTEGVHHHIFNKTSLVKFIFNSVLKNPLNIFLKGYNPGAINGPDLCRSDEGVLEISAA